MNEGERGGSARHRAGGSSNGSSPSRFASRPLWVFHVVLVASGIVFSAAYAVYVLVVSLPRVSIGQARWPLVAEAGLFLAGAGLLGAYLWRFVRRAKRVNSRQSTVEG